MQRPFKKILKHYTLAAVKFVKGNPYLSILLLLYYANILAISLMNGYRACREGVCGLWFAGIMVHDSFWHISLINTAFQVLPFQMPNYAGVSLQGYHYLYDFILYLLTYTGISAIFIWWKIMPTIFFVAFSMLAIYYAYSIRKSKLFIFLYILFIFFGGTMSFTPRFIHTGSFLDASDTFLQMNTVVLSQNVAFSFVLILYCIVLLSKRKYSLRHHMIMSICLFVTMGLKFYGGLILYLLLSSYALLRFRCYTDKRLLLQYLFLYTISVVAAIFVFYNPTSSLKSGSIFIFSPLTLAHPMIESPDLYYLESLTLARYVLLAAGNFSPRLIAIETLTVILFFFHYVGVYFIGALYLIYKVYKRKITSLEVSFVVCIITTLIFPLLFIQKGGYINTLQFIYYGMLLMSYFAAQSCYFIVIKSNRFIKVLFLSILILISLPNNITNMKMPFDTPYVFEEAELNALDYLRKQPDGDIFSIPLSENSYVSAFTGKQTYISDIQQLEITGVDYTDRMNVYSQLKKIRLTELPVRYFYFVKDYASYPYLINKPKNEDLSKIFENDRVVIYTSNHLRK